MYFLVMEKENMREGVLSSFFYLCKHLSKKLVRLSFTEKDQTIRAVYYSWGFQELAKAMYLDISIHDTDTLFYPEKISLMHFLVTLGVKLNNIRKPTWRFINLLRNW